MPFDRRLIFCINWPLLALAALLFGVGVLNLYSASGFRMGDEVSMQPFYSKQFIWGLAGLGCMLAMVLFDYKHLAEVAWPLMVVTLVLLLLVLVAGKTVSGARRWLPIGGYSFQPSELAKIATLLLAAKILSKRSERIGWMDLAGILAVTLPVVGLIVVEPDLGTGLNVLLLVCGLILFRGLASPVFKTLLLAVPILAPCGWFFLKPYQKGRILTLFNPERDPLAPATTSSNRRLPSAPARCGARASWRARKANCGTCRKSTRILQSPCLPRSGVLSAPSCC